MIFCQKGRFWIVLQRKKLKANLLQIKNKNYYWQKQFPLLIKHKPYKISVKIKFINFSHQNP
jgi:hypothetical protein